VQKKFDHNGMVTFESYAQPDITNIAAAYSGTSTTYDPLGRVLTMTASSELGNLTTTNVYGTPFSVSTTNPRGNVVTTTMSAYDDPGKSMVKAVAMPLGVALSIGRDVFGKPLAITRSGSGLSATRSYVYDGFQRLCKTIEPETGATVQEYYAGGNVQWRASGLALPSPAACDRGSVPAAKQMRFGYDALDRLLTTTFGDGSPSITRTYTADGLLETSSAGGSIWTNTYNNMNRHEFARHSKASQNTAFQN
jgi:YD repeat-containing protein